MSEFLLRQLLCRTPRVVVEPDDMNRPSRPNQQKLVEDWNSNHPEGSAVIVKLDSGESKPTTTRSPAWVMGGHTAVVMLDGIAGAYSLERVKAVG